MELPVSGSVPGPTYPRRSKYEAQGLQRESDPRGPDAHTLARGKSLDKAGILIPMGTGSMVLRDDVVGQFKGASHDSRTTH